MRRLGAAAIAAMAAIGCAGCTHPSPPAACTAIGGSASLQITLMFGLTRPDGQPISDAHWQDFLARVVTPRFPDGLTVSEGMGQWRDRVTSRITHEPSRLVWIVTPDRPGLRQDIDAIRAAYRSEFAQQSVGVLAGSGCAAF
jgi:hypothetical protein